MAPYNCVSGIFLILCERFPDIPPSLYLFSVGWVQRFSNSGASFSHGPCSEVYVNTFFRNKLSCADGDSKYINDILTSVDLFHTCNKDGPMTDYFFKIKAVLLVLC